jgi:hypothetical protein
MPDAGAVLHAQTTEPEMYFLGVTRSDLWAVTRIRGTSIAVGGSIRIPSAFNGLCSFKPTYGRVPVEPTTRACFPPCSDRWRAIARHDPPGDRDLRPGTRGDELPAPEAQSAPQLRGCEGAATSPPIRAGRG